jgi:vacuolar protein sorting-associated protein IST1
MIQKLKLQTPDPVLVNRYLAEIAKGYKVDWAPADADLQGPLQSPVQQDQSHQSAPSYSVEVKLPLTQPPAESAVQFPEIPPGPSAGAPASSTGPDFEELEKRFEALKKKK